MTERNGTPPTYLFAYVSGTEPVPPASPAAASRYYLVRNEIGENRRETTVEAPAVSTRWARCALRRSQVRSCGPCVTRLHQNASRSGWLTRAALSSTSSRPRPLRVLRDASRPSMSRSFHRRRVAPASSGTSGPARLAGLPPEGGVPASNRVPKHDRRDNHHS